MGKGKSIIKLILSWLFFFPPVAFPKARSYWAVKGQ